MSHRVHIIGCPGCGRELRGPTREELGKRVLRHARNCASLNFARKPEPEMPAVEAPAP